MYTHPGLCDETSPCLCMQVTRQGPQLAPNVIYFSSHPRMDKSTYSEVGKSRQPLLGHFKDLINANIVLRWTDSAGYLGLLQVLRLNFSFSSKKVSEIYIAGLIDFSSSKHPDDVTRILEVHQLWCEI